MLNFQFNTNGVTETISNPESQIQPGEEIIHESGDYGNATFINTVAGNANIWFRELDIAAPTTLHCHSGEPYLYIHINISKPMRYSCPGMPDLFFSADQFNLLFGSQMELSTRLQKGNYRTMEVHYPLSYLQNMANHIPHLQTFLNLVKKDGTGTMFDTNLNASHEISTIIKHIVYCAFNGDIKTIFIEGKALELLTVCLNKGLKVFNDPIILNQHEKEKLTEVKQYLQENIDQHRSTEELTRITGLNEWILFKGFRQLFNVPIHEYLFIKRVRKAKEQLLSSNNHSDFSSLS
ncbi:hypothetical protein SAMN05518672_1113 [Chitinophaga sp. CF118]|uniref:helix-turn-helix domain-containing protein n=1 Tax=Chitinophaga sp. CF118 TaxID=1884367 RepID=UPI0008E0352F|nr:AraC family transcriptional regulator [Chitinophaga sp. CF118]SFE84276.1 hypothetical protein SAMN05518672_1113 [Chitinophaga sp. CF118]